jgi:hypothetical protein
MLAYFLAIALALASLYLYLSAFIARDIHRQDDFLWSGVGLFYALILWICAGQVKGSVLLGQGAAVALVLSFGWQTLRLRRAIAHPDQPIDTEEFSVIAWLKGRFWGKKLAPVTPKGKSPSETVTEAPNSPAKSTEIKEKEQKKDSTLLVASTPTDEQIIVEEEAIAVTDASATEETSDENPLNDILEDLEEQQDDTATSTTSNPTLGGNTLDFEPYISENEAETVIETYTPPTINPIVTETEKSEESSETVTTDEEKEVLDELDEFMEEIKNEDQEDEDKK